MSYPTLTRITRCRELVGQCVAAGITGDDVDPRTWWPSVRPGLPRIRPYDALAARAEYDQRLRRKHEEHVRIHRSISRRDRGAVLARGRCEYCLYGSADAVDHIVPVARGGTRLLSNLAAACDRCNTQKGDFTPEEWAQAREEVGLPPLPGLAGVREPAA